MRCLEDEVSYVLGGAEEDCWYRVLDLFQDATVFQTIAFCRARAPHARLEQLVVRRGPDVVAAALVRLVSIPFAATSIAYVLWGPLCHRWGADCDGSALRCALEILRDEYVAKRRFGLRIAPRPTRADGAEWSPLFLEQGYRQVALQPTKHTIILDLDRPLEQLRKGLDQKWRNHLNSAERNNLTVRQGDDRSLFDLFVTVYREMLTRKQLGEPGDLRAFLAIHAALPERFKLMAFVALEEGEPAAGVICSAIGHRGIYLFGATGGKGMKNKASYLLQWRVVEWLCQQGCELYDLHGTNAEANPGVYAFKKGLCGKSGREVEIRGPFDASGGPRVRVLMTAADRANGAYKRLTRIYRRYRGF